MGDGGAPGPGLVVASQLQALGEAGLHHVLGLAGQAGREAVTRHLGPAVSDGAGGGAALDIVVEEEAPVRVQTLPARRRPHPKLDASRGGHEARPAIQVATEGHQGEALLPDLHLVLALAPGVPQREVHHLQLDPLPEVGHDVPDALPPPEVVARVARTGDVALSADADPASAIREDAGLAAVADVGPAPAPALRLGQVCDHVEGAGAAPDPGALPHHGHQDVPVVVELPHPHHGAARRVQDIAVATVRGEGGLVDHNHLALLALEVELGLAARRESLEVSSIGQTKEKRQTDN